jgi:hypothetical protein
VGDVRDRTVRVLVQRVDDPIHHIELVSRGHVLPPHRVVRRLDQIDHGRRDPELEVLGRLPQPLQVGKVLGAELKG